MRKPSLKFPAAAVIAVEHAALYKYQDEGCGCICGMSKREWSASNQTQTHGDDSVANEQTSK